MITPSNQSKHPTVLLILDGWGYRNMQAHNAIDAAHTPHWDKWWKRYPHCLLEASGAAVGLPEGQMGNSEVGHMHIGAGRIIPQDFTRINQAILDESFLHNPVLTSTIENMKKQQKSIHVLGLLSPGGVHSHENHLFAFLNLCAQTSFNQVYLHLFLDGRDTPPQSASKSLEALQEQLLLHPVAKIGSITGRYFAMDRDARWERLEPVYRLLTENKSTHQFPTAEKALQFYYENDIYDEFVPPTRINDAPPIQSGDAIFFFNYRSDRARQLTQAFVDEQFNGFLRPIKPQLSSFISMTRYSEALPTQCVFPPLSLSNTLGEILAQHGLRQLRIAETEKYAHVTFFLNGGREEPFDEEHRMLIPSPQVATYDLKPEMSAPEITQAVVDAISKAQYEVIIINFANADMVGHTGDFNATVNAIECLDRCMGKIWQAVEKHHGQMLITADHGNAEVMFDETAQQKQTAHTSEPVPFLYLGDQWIFTHPTGSLIDVAPTLLDILGIELPKDMTGHTLMAKK